MRRRNPEDSEALVRMTLRIPETMKDKVRQLASQNESSVAEHLRQVFAFSFELDDERGHPSADLYNYLNDQPYAGRGEIVTLTIRVPVSMKDRIEREARLHNLHSVSAYARFVIARYHRGYDRGII